MTRRRARRERIAYNRGRRAARVWWRRGHPRGVGVIVPLRLNYESFTAALIRIVDAARGVP